MIWILFTLMILVFISIDLGIFNRKAHIISVKEATVWTSIWVSFALLFSGVIYFIYSNGLINNNQLLSPTDATLKYITGYLIELSLSIDNIFVIAVIFKTFQIPQIYQHRVLFWGIIGAIVFRAVMILFGVALIHRFSWMIYVFGAFLLYTAYKMLMASEKEYNPKNSFAFKQIRKIFPITDEIESEKFFIRKKHILAATPLFIALIVVEVTDVLFALDSIPAILAITSDPFLVFSSNILAILGLRSMYFFLSSMLTKFKYLEYSLVAILSFVGLKMLLSNYVHFSEWISLGVILITLTLGIFLSIIKSRKAV